MKDVVLSIIIPAYNVQDYIEECLSSLLLQSSEKVEIVLVNDGSTDLTKHIIDSKFSNQIKSGALRVIHQSNSGVSEARNVGVKNASGSYVGFVDADDFLMPNYISTLLEAISESNSDIIEFAFKTFLKSPDELNRSRLQFTNRYFGTHKVSEVLNHVYATARWYPWSRIFKKKLFQARDFPKGVRFCEDMMTIPFLYEKSENILVLPDVLYGYRINQNGATLNIKPDYYENLINFYFEVKKLTGFRFDLMRFSIAFSLYSCSLKAGNHINIPEEIWDDMLKLRPNLKIYFYLEWRKIFIICYPSIYNFFKKMVRKNS